MTLQNQFGNYILLKKIGSGGMAELYLARQMGVMGFERILAIKRILPHLTKDTDFIQMFINEAKLAAQITHPNIVQIYDFGAIDGLYYIAMEYIMGKSLADILEKGKRIGFPLPGGLACVVTSKIAAGLDYAYKGKTLDGKPLGIIHRDVSPQNILISYRGEVKLVDFGIAKAVSSGNHTQAGTLKGKIAYLSPEQAWGKPVDHRSDLFSLGIVLHEMLTERRLFKSQNEFETLEMVRSAMVPLPSTVKPYLPKALNVIALKALAKDPQDRYSDAQAFQAALEDYLRTLTASPVTKDLADYLHLLYQNDIETELNEFQQATQIDIAPHLPVASQTVRLTPLSTKGKRFWLKTGTVMGSLLILFIVLKGWSHRPDPHQEPLPASPVVSSQPLPPVPPHTSSPQENRLPAPSGLPLTFTPSDQSRESALPQKTHSLPKSKKETIKETVPEKEIVSSSPDIHSPEKALPPEKRLMEEQPHGSAHTALEEMETPLPLSSTPTVNLPPPPVPQNKSSQEEAPVPILP